MYDPAMPLLPPRALIGMVHTAALPGTPFFGLPIDEIAAAAVSEARTLAQSGFDAIIVENMHDRPYVLPPHGPEITAAMTRIVRAVREAVGVPLGVQILASGEREALAVALAAGAQFIRCENFVFSHVADEGLLERAAAGPLLRYRRAIGADHIRIFCDIKKKHASHAVTADLTIAEAAHAAELFAADGLIETGAFTGDPAKPIDVAALRAASRLPVLVGSGVTPEQVASLFAAGADALIVGSFIKQGGRWDRPVDADRCRQLAAAAAAART
jgi:membrane complex biogenesis BtpA family protein